MYVWNTNTKSVEERDGLTVKPGCLWLNSVSKELQPEVEEFIRKHNDDFKDTPTYGLDVNLIKCLLEMLDKAQFDVQPRESGIWVLAMLDAGLSTTKIFNALMACPGGLENVDAFLWNFPRIAEKLRPGYKLMPQYLPMYEEQPEDWITVLKKPEEFAQTLEEEIKKYIPGGMEITTSIKVAVDMAEVATLAAFNRMPEGLQTKVTKAIGTDGSVLMRCRLSYMTPWSVDAMAFDWEKFLKHVRPDVKIGRGVFSSEVGLFQLTELMNSCDVMRLGYQLPRDRYPEETDPEFCEE